MSINTMERNFRAKGADNNYQVVATPMTGKRLMNISGTTDDLVPYRGGLSKHIPAKDGKLGFVDAEESIFSMGEADGLRRRENCPDPPELMAIWKSLVTSMVM